MDLKKKLKRVTNKYRKLYAKFCDSLSPEQTVQLNDLLIAKATAERVEQMLKNEGLKQ